MFSRRPAFAQVMSFLDPTEFARCVAQFPMHRSPRGLSALDHFLALCFAQLTHRESLRDLAACLQSARAYHAGFRSRLTRTNLAYASQHRDWRVFAAVAEVLIRRVRRCYEDSPTDPDLPEVCYALDASYIDLSLALFPWAKWEPTDAAVKLHALWSLHTRSPAWLVVTDAGFPDVKSLDLMPVEPGAFYVMDRGYLDFRRLARLQEEHAYFVVRCPRQVRFRVIKSKAVDKSTGLRCDQIIRLKTYRATRDYPHLLRRVRIYDEEHKLSLVLLSNHLTLPAGTISLLYRKRWQVELFFKWIKQHLKLRTFLGRSQNAVRCQVWSAICAYLLVVLAKKECGISQTLHRVLQTLSISPFEQISLAELLADGDPHKTEASTSNQLTLNGL